MTAVERIKRQLEIEVAMNSLRDQGWRVLQTHIIDEDGADLRCRVTLDHPTPSVLGDEPL